MVHRHTDKVETVAAEEFAKWNLVENYNNAKDRYATFTEGDPGREKALQWVMAELQNSLEALKRDNKQPYCIDIGCAHGQPVMERLANQGFEAVGVDLSDGLLGQARENLAHRANAHFELADMRLWEPPSDRKDGNVDCVVTFYALGHLPLSDYRAMVAKMARWLKSGTGVFVLSTVAHMHGWVTTQAATFPHTSLTIEENTAFLEQNGCEVIKAWEEEWSSQNIAQEDSRTHQFICARKR